MKPSASIQITTHSEAETRNLGQLLGNQIDRPIRIALTGDLGSGKTAFVQGLAKGLDVSQQYYVTSPTFTLINEYPGRLPLVHIDLYRLEGVEDFEDIGLDELLHDQAVVAVEWADKLTDDLSGDCLYLRFEIIDDNFRRINIIAIGQNAIDLIKALEHAANRVNPDIA